MSAFTFAAPASAEPSRVSKRRSADDDSDDEVVIAHGFARKRLTTPARSFDRHDLAIFDCVFRFASSVVDSASSPERVCRDVSLHAERVATLLRVTSKMDVDFITGCGLDRDFVVAALQLFHDDEPLTEATIKEARICLRSFMFAHGDAELLNGSYYTPKILATTSMDKRRRVFLERSGQFTRLQECVEQNVEADVLFQETEDLDMIEAAIATLNKGAGPAFRNCATKEDHAAYFEGSDLGEPLGRIFELVFEEYVSKFLYREERRSVAGRHLFNVLTLLAHVPAIAHKLADKPSFVETLIEDAKHATKNSMFYTEQVYAPMAKLIGVAL